MFYEKQDIADSIESMSELSLQKALDFADYENSKEIWCCVALREDLNKNIAYSIIKNYKNTNAMCLLLKHRFSGRDAALFIKDLRMSGYEDHDYIKNYLSSHIKGFESLT